MSRVPSPSFSGGLAHGTAGVLRAVLLRLLRPRTARARDLVWFAVTILGLVACTLPWLGWEPAGLLPRLGAAVVTSSFCYALSVRTGGRPWIAGGLALALTSLAVVTGAPRMLAGAAVSTAVVAAVLGVMATQPAARFPAVVRECLVAVAVAGAGAFAVAAYQPQVSLVRVGHLVLGLSLLGAIGLVYRLGAGLHGLGRRGTIVLASGVLLLFVTLAYTEALSRWGSPGLVHGLEAGFRAVQETVGAVPRPIEVLIGFPALAWGVSLRARRRQGWWVAVFGVSGLAVVAVSLLRPGMTPALAALELFYSAVLGLALGYAVIRVDKYLTGTRGRRARQIEEALAHRPEPGRMRPLL